jgi:acyl carrier protein
MSTAAMRPISRMMTEENVFQLLAETLEISRKQITLETRSSDIPEWDSMGLLGILSALDRERIACDIGDTASLQSVKGVIEIVRSAGRLQ